MKYFKKIFLLILALLFAFGLFEIGIRLDEAYVGWRFSVKDPESVLWKYDPVIGWVKKENFDGHFINPKIRRKTKVRTNSKGLRDVEYPYTRTPGVKRILLLGDSMTVGLEVPRGRVMDDRLEFHLKNHVQAEAINAGTRGYGTDQILLYYEQEGRKFNADLVIYLYSPNDPENNITIHNPNRKFGKSYFLPDPQNPGAIVLKGTPVPENFSPKDAWLVSRPEFSLFFPTPPSKPEERSKALFKVWEKVKPLLKKNKTPQKNSGGGQRKSDAVIDFEWEITEKIIHRLDQKVREEGSNFLVYEISRGLLNPRHLRMKDICLKLSIPYTNGYERFFNISKGDMSFTFKGDGHLNEKGHDLTGLILSDYLKKNPSLLESTHYLHLP